MKIYGITGYPLGHTFSPGYFAEKFAREGIDASYKAFPVGDIDALSFLLQQHSDLCGLNVTIPYKQAVMPLLDEIDDAAKAVGAVNCIAIANGKTKGFNTDIIGFERSLQPLLHPTHRQALILGTGGSSRAVAYVLQKLHIEHTYVSRKKKPGILQYDELTKDIISQHTLIVNTTPLGMYPDISSCPPLPYEALSAGHLLYDLVYNPAETQFLAKGKERGTAIKNGLEMLHLQAEASWEIWNSSSISR